MKLAYRVKTRKLGVYSERCCNVHGVCEIYATIAIRTIGAAFWDMITEFHGVSSKVVAIIVTIWRLIFSKVNIKAYNSVNMGDLTAYSPELFPGSEVNIYLRVLQI